ncbi:MAG: hypothetical protein PHF86_00345 [Candidatus Nanoarchaeia archaeon]|nr:hypothetical protein [Candidatus Nanoarchaeia archaeon]
MKKLIILSIAILINISIFSQEKLDSISFKSFAVTHYFKDKKCISETEVSFYISNNQMISTLNDQDRVIRFIETPKKEKGVWSIQCKDEGGFNCILFIGKFSKSEDYFVYISYNNLEMIYQCKISEDKPYDDNSSNLLILESPKDSITYAGKIKYWNFKE